jgi:hypothetical protein
LHSELHTSGCNFRIGDGLRRKDVSVKNLAYKLASILVWLSGLAAVATPRDVDTRISLIIQLSRFKRIEVVKVNARFPIMISTRNTNKPTKHKHYVAAT